MATALATGGNNTNLNATNAPFASWSYRRLIPTTSAFLTNRHNGFGIFVSKCESWASGRDELPHASLSRICATSGVM